MQLLQQSHNQLLSLIFKGTITRTGTLSLQHRTTRMSKKSRRTKRVAHIAAKAAKERKLTVGAQFRNSLQMLMDKMVTSQPIFIRCIKPNHTKAPKTFDDKYVLDQLLYTGMLQTIKIRREGFAIRPTFAEFVEKYKILLLQPKLKPDPLNCSHILKTTGLTGWQIGKTKVFLKYFHTDKLAERMEAMAKQAVHIQRIVRGFLGRQRVRRKRREADEEASRVEVFGDMIAGLTISSLDNQNKAVANDKNIPKSFFHKPEDKPVMVTPLEQFLPPKPGVPLNRQTAYGGADSAEDSDDWSGSDSDEVIDDDFEPVKTTGLTKYGEVGTKEASVQWFKQTQSVKLRMSTGSFAEWFHGIITRRRSEQLLQSKPVGCFLIRVSESRFGFTLSFRAQDRCRHYMIDQTPNGKYIIIGEPKVHRTLADMIKFLQKNKLSNYGDVLTVPCGQEEGTCDYSDLVSNEEDLYSEVNTPEMERKSVKMPIPDRVRPPPEPVVPPPVPDRNSKATPVTSKAPKATMHPPKFNSNAKKQAFESLLQDQQAQDHAGIYGQATTLTPSKAKLPPRK